MKNEWEREFADEFSLGHKDDWDIYDTKLGYEMSAEDILNALNNHDKQADEKKRLTLEEINKIIENQGLFYQTLYQKDNRISFDHYMLISNVLLQLTQALEDVIDD